MRSRIQVYLKKYCSSSPREVDRLIVSAFLQKNKLTVRKNTFLKKYIVSPSQKKEFEKLQGFVSLINKETNRFGLEELIQVFEFVISPSERKINGAIYTPKNIREFIIEKTFYSQRDNIDKCKIVDMACGCGGFIADAAKKLRYKTKKSYYKIFKSQIFGLDIQPYSITRTKIFLTLMALVDGEDRKFFEFNLYSADALNFKWTKKIKNFRGFDIVLGNPPYVCSRNMSDKSKAHLLKWEVCGSGHPDLYIPFFQIGIEHLTASGTLGFITMNSFIKTLNARALREYFKRNRLELQIIDFGTEQIFRSRNTYTCICLVGKVAVEYVRYAKIESNLLSSPIEYNRVNYSQLDSHKGWNLQNNEIISIIESTGTSFGELFKTRSGIATLKNEIYIFDPIDEDREFYYLQNGNVFPIEKDICRDIVNPNKLGDLDSINAITEKVIFPYDDGDKPTLLSEAHLRANFPQAYRYLNYKKDILSGRDKGNGNYDKWFAFGRTQSLEKMRYKLLFPHIANKIPNYTINTDDDLLFYNGLAVIGESTQELAIAKKLMETRLFWYYITQTSKPYSSGYYSLSKNYIKNFGVCRLSESETDFVLAEENRDVLDDFFEKKYKIEFS